MNEPRDGVVESDADIEDKDRDRADDLDTDDGDLADDGDDRDERPRASDGPDRLHGLIGYILGQIVSKPEEVKIELNDNDRRRVYEVRVAGDDVGVVIGRSGRTINAIRTLLRGVPDAPERVWVELIEEDEGRGRRNRADRDDRDDEESEDRDDDRGDTNDRDDRPDDDRDDRDGGRDQDERDERDSEPRAEAAREAEEPRE